MTLMSEHDLRIWSQVLGKLGLRKHPKKLSNRERDAQKTILTYISFDPYNLPDKPEWDDWYQWHIEAEDPEGPKDLRK